MKKIILFFILISVSIFSGLQMSTRIIDKVHIVNVIGYDYVEDDTFRGTVVIPVFKPDKTVENVTFSSEASLVYENRNKLNTQSSRPLLGGKLQVVLFNTELAKHGIIDYLDNLERDPTVGSRVDLAVVEGSANKMLNKDYEGIPTGIYFSSLFEHNIETGSLPRMNLHLFVNRFFAEGIDPILPILTQDEDKIKINGIALFKNDKYVDELGYHDSIVFIMILEHFTRGTFIIENPENRDRVAAIEIIESNRKVHIKKHHASDPKLTVHVKASGYIREYNKGLVNEKTMKRLEKKMEKEIETTGEKQIAKFQELNIDPLGLGQAMKNHTRDWNKAKWVDQYPHLDIDVKAEVDLKEAGIIK